MGAYNKYLVLASLSPMGEYWPAGGRAGELSQHQPVFSDSKAVFKGVGTKAPFNGGFAFG